ncbi:hypothetical protein [Ovoidimarina sediminis]|uniref:hypothetical protein n=1 Tax=Ovoidimarina sediminis TaxID=3079856 RepID=UPI0029071936|nr:hypothetical protein [Rhodophyticola sp. MJ-SS7]MDU8942190.1 hypothetical protein [Rhodophyticola sp. MJ-SS7]
MLLTTAPLGYFDTAGYVDQGRAAVELAITRLGFLPEAASNGGEGIGSEGGIRLLRAPAYTLFSYLTTQSPVGLALMTWAQTALTLFGLGALACAGRTCPTRSSAILGFLPVAGLTTLPWMASYAMPDILGAALIVFYMLIAGPFEKLGRAGQILLTLIACFAVAAHYGNIPLAAALALMSLLLRALAGKPLLLAGVAAVVPILTAVLLNLIASAAATGSAEVAPKRLPILLSRSIEDGPALWHLRNACEAERYEICAAFDEFPETVGDFLWSEAGIKSLSAEELDTLRREESAILFNAFREYPVAQTWALSRNALLQVIRIGTGEILPIVKTADTPVGFTVAAQDTLDTPVFEIFDWVTKVATAVASVWLLYLWLTGRLSVEDRRMLLVLIAAIAVNALIFGGLSYPVDRYQSRIAWLIPAFLAILLARSPASARAQ